MWECVASSSFTFLKSLLKCAVGEKCSAFRFFACFVCGCEGACLCVWKIVKLMVTVFNFAYLHDFHGCCSCINCCCCCVCFGPIKITLSNYLKPMLFCFFNYFYVPRRGFFIVCLCVSYKLEQKFVCFAITFSLFRCSMTSL